MATQNVTPSVLDEGNEIVLANMMKEKRLICSRNTNLAELLPSYSYVTVNRTLLYNCELDASLSYVQRSIGSCRDDETDTTMKFVSNFAFETMFGEFINRKEPPKPTVGMKAQRPGSWPGHPPPPWHKFWTLTYVLNTS